MGRHVIIRYWAGAARAAGTDTETIDAATVADVRAAMSGRSALAGLSRVASFLVDGVRCDDAAELADGVQVDVLPPFAGG